MNNLRELTIDELDTVSGCGDDWTFASALEMESKKREMMKTEGTATEQAKPSVARPIKIRLN
ncbi:hypothetical protein [Bradyrhizobium sp. OAE829]|uniref:hypothetical protein n=1 Tax=Bradyrhizobium sp. OAE829 TaxID=2663807 RepID=UPI0017893283